MRTTLSLDDNLLAEAKRRAHQRGISVGAVVEDALRRTFTREKTTQRPEIPVFRGGSGVRPGVDLISNRAILEALDEEREIDSIR